MSEKSSIFNDDEYSNYFGQAGILMKVTFKNKGLELVGVDNFAFIYVLCNFAHVFFPVWTGKSPVHRGIHEKILF
ncbi:hypothetical protein KKJ25_18420 [Xenorhabdus bovienii]|uniref:hypothetical protein n=1 Tax=Xenorhabdus bovienii TaxID=40576 RepID=UPI00237CE629|nr:hypothetical protein [Xenorhabdus bovienii]MDE1496847.1 hypothetical protein [Xenorhabdus bovienii]MDE9474803.1 hypothetical protein [Xenorhabdus bovienii]